jgi:hypothetical protein
MSAFIALAVLAFAVFCILGTLALVGFVLKVLFWAVLFPIRLVFKLVFGIVGLGLAAFVGPILLLVAGIAVVGALAAAFIALVAPLLPLLLLAFLGWAIYRASTRSSASGFAGS